MCSNRQDIEVQANLEPFRFCMRPYGLSMAVEQFVERLHMPYHLAERSDLVY